MAEASPASAPAVAGEEKRTPAAASTAQAPAHAPAAGAAAATGKQDEETFNPEEEVTEGNWTTPQVEVKEVTVETGEEDEEVFWKCRSKLYRWATAAGGAAAGGEGGAAAGEWKERGIGEAKLLRHKQNKKIRFLLRQEKTLKIVANHYEAQEFKRKFEEAAAENAKILGASVAQQQQQTKAAGGEATTASATAQQQKEEKEEAFATKAAPKPDARKTTASNRSSDSSTPSAAAAEKTPSSHQQKDGGKAAQAAPMQQPKPAGEAAAAAK